MSVILTPGSPLISLDLYYVEERKPTGNVIFHFINNPDDMARWRAKGYHTEQEIREWQQSQRASEPGSTPGAVKQTRVSEKVPDFDASKVIQILHTEWKKLNWKDQNYIFSRSLKTSTTNDGKTHAELDSILYRDMKLKHCLKKWNVTEPNGEPVSVTSDSIDMLVPEVAQEMLSAFERFTEPTSEELKN